MIHKLKAFAVHIGISLVIFFALLSFIIYFWYPQPFFTSDGGWQGIRIIAAVDLVLGPLLTLIVYKPNKPRLKMDLTIIGIIQAAALGWGLWVVHHERPIATVYAEGAFSSVTANKMTILGMTEDKLKAFGERTPVWIYSKLPDDPDALQEIRIRAAQSGRGVHFETEFYTPMDKTAGDKIISEKLNVEAWIEDRPEFKQTYEKFVKRYKEQMDDIIFIPWLARHGRNIIALSKEDLSYIATLDIRPPEVDEEKPGYRS